jgi:hypothetical protein
MLVLSATVDFPTPKSTAMTTVWTVLEVIAAIVIAVSLVDLGLGLLVTLVSDVFGALRGSGKGTQQ